MTMHELKDHYRTLGLQQSASVQQVKQAYRKMAMQYHPDRNSVGYAEAHFRDIKEAYEVLSHAGKRKAYDEERWLNGMGTRAKDQVVITPEWILKECNRLSRHMEAIDTYRMSHSALTEYVDLLLSDAHMAVLLQTDDAETKYKIIDELLKATRGLHYNYMHKVGSRLSELAGTGEELSEKINAIVDARKKQYAWERVKPLIVVMVTLLLCLLMYWYSKK
jgi:curved DNA-binding protein CbpA